MVMSVSSLLLPGGDKRGKVSSEVGGLQLRRIGAAKTETSTRQLLQLLDGVHDAGDVGLENHSAHDDLIKDGVHPVRVEDQVQLADVLEAPIQSLNEYLDEVEDA